MLRTVRNFRAGDFIRVNDQFGRVTDRGLFHVEIQTADSDLITLPNLYLAAEPGSYDLLLGSPDAAPPHYELEKIRSTILAVPAAGVISGLLEGNPDFSAARRWSDNADIQSILMWAVLGLAVIILVLITLRTARQEQ